MRANLRHMKPREFPRYDIDFYNTNFPAGQWYEEIIIKSTLQCIFENLHERKYPEVIFVDYI